MDELRRFVDFRVAALQSWLDQPATAPSAFATPRRRGEQHSEPRQTIMRSRATSDAPVRCHARFWAQILTISARTCAQK